MHRPAFVLCVAILIFAGMIAGATAVPSGHWKGGDIDFRVKDNKIKKMTVTSVHTCQVIGTGEFFNELQTFAPPGKFKIRRNGKVEGQRLKATAAGTDYYDLRFAFVGKFKGKKFTTVVQTGYKYWSYSPPTNISCYSQKKFRAKRS